MKNDNRILAARSAAMTSGEIFAICKTYTAKGPSYGIMIKDEYDVSISSDVSDNLDEVMGLLRLTVENSCSAIHLGSVIEDWKAEKRELAEEGPQMPTPVYTSFAKALFGRRVASVKETIRKLRNKIRKFSK